MRFNVRLLISVLVLALGSCGQCGSSSSSAPAVHLVFTGPAAGTPASGTSGCQAFTSSKRFGYELDGAQMNGQDVVLTMTVYSNFNGQGTYPVGTVLDGGAELRLEVGSYVGSTTSGAGTLKVNPDGRSGTIDAALPEGEHVSGSWRCDKYEVLTS